MAKQPVIPDARQPFLEGPTQVNRTWYRFLDALKNIAGSTMAPLVVAPNAILTAATISAGGTISSPDLSPRTLIGNSGATAGQPTEQVVDDSLSFTGNILGLPELPPMTLWGNPTDVPEQPQPITPGTNLSFDGNVLNAVISDDDENLLYSIRDTRGEIATTDQRLSAVEIAIASIRDTRGELAEQQQQINDVTILSFLSYRLTT